MDPNLLMMLLSLYGNQSGNYLGGGMQQNSMLGGLGNLLNLLGYGGLQDQSLSGGGMDGVSQLYQALFGNYQPAGYQQTFYDPNARTPGENDYYTNYNPNPGVTAPISGAQPPSGWTHDVLQPPLYPYTGGAPNPYSGAPATSLQGMLPGQTYTNPVGQVYTQPWANMPGPGFNLYNYANTPFTPMGGPGVGAIQGYGFGLDPRTGGRGGPVLTDFVGQRHKTDPVPVGTHLPSAWGDIVYSGGGLYNMPTPPPNLGGMGNTPAPGGGGTPAPAPNYNINPNTPPLTYTGAPGQYHGTATYNWDPNTPPLTYTGAPSQYRGPRY